MKSKLLTLPVLIVIAVFVLADVVAPGLAEQTVRHRLENRLGTHDVTVSLASTPSALLVLGQIDHAHVTAHDGRVGDVLTTELALDGDGIKLDMGELFSGDSVKVASAGSITLTGVISEDNLKELLARKVERLQNTEVKMAPDGSTITGNVKLLGRMADLTCHATVVDDGGQLMMHMQSLTLTNAAIGRAQAGDLFGDIPLIKRGKMPFGARFTDVKMQEGKVVLTAEYDPAAANAPEDVLAPYYQQ